MKFCNISGCGVSITEKQAETTLAMFNKEVCEFHQKQEQFEMDAATETFMPPEYAILREAGWELDNGQAFKTIDGKGVSIMLSKISEKAKAVEVGGMKWKMGEGQSTQKIEDELLTLFKKFDAGKKAPEKPIQTNTPPAGNQAAKKIAAPQEKSGGLALGVSMVLFSKKVVCNLGSYESISLEVSGASSFEECDRLLDDELARFDVRHRTVRTFRGIPE